MKDGVKAKLGGGAVAVRDEESFLPARLLDGLAESSHALRDFAPALHARARIPAPRQRDADGLYSPPPYLYDEFSSDYDNFLVNGPPPVLADTEKGMDGTVKHFISGGANSSGDPSGERVCGSITDRHANQTVMTYGTTVTFPASGSELYICHLPGHEAYGMVGVATIVR